MVSLRRRPRCDSPAAVALHHHGDPEAGAERVEQERRRMIEEQKEWLEDILAGLLSNGVPHNEIHIHRHPQRTVVTVRGVAKYERACGPHDAASRGAGLLDRPCLHAAAGALAD